MATKYMYLTESEILELAHDDEDIDTDDVTTTGVIRAFFDAAAKQGYDIVSIGHDEDGLIASVLWSRKVKSPAPTVTVV